MFTFLHSKWYPAFLLSYSTCSRTPLKVLNLFVPPALATEPIQVPVDNQPDFENGTPVVVSVSFLYLALTFKSSGDCEVLMEV